VVEQRELRVVQMTLEAKDVVSVRFARPEGDNPLPEWTPGAHIDVYVPDGSTRQYSLCGDPADRSSWQIAILREPHSRGGSVYFHDQVRVGDLVMVTRPKNHFVLEEAAHHTLIAGGIGITPMMAMAEELDRTGRPYELVYGGRSLDCMAFRDRLGGLADRVRLIPQDVDGLPDLQALLENVPEDGLVYVCGPVGLLRAVEQAAQTRFGPDQDVVRFELFSRTGVEAPQESPPVDGETYDLVLAQSGHTLRLPMDTCILDKVLALGIEVENDCHEGICGSCITRVLSGAVDHRDLVLTRKEQAAMDQMLICVSRPTCTRLELDL
jgi:ferredoxin-NADP reductase